LKLNGLDFHVEVDGDGPPLLLLHGFTGSVRAWDAIRSQLASDAQVIALDLIGHGQSASPPDPARYTLEWCARDLVGLLDALHVERVDLLGYSMGGRAALHFAVHAPERIKHLVLESASPGLEDSVERARRAQADDALAETILSNGVPAFVEQWEQQPLLMLAPHVADDVRMRQHALRLQNNPLGLANSLRGMGTGRQMPLWSRLNDLKLPVHLIVGANDRRYCAIGERMHGMLPGSDLTVIDAAGHTAHLDQPARFVHKVKKLTRTEIRCYIDPERLF
jgi:2-succinyl-6-hydroxy-2,4-cyclohexadiene-1-carboxylate synthase